MANIKLSAAHQRLATTARQMKEDYDLEIGRILQGMLNAITIDDRTPNERAFEIRDRLLHAKFNQGKLSERYKDI